MFGKKNVEGRKTELVVVDPGKHTTKAMTKDSRGTQVLLISAPDV